MKKIFFVALAATLLAAGCQKTEIINHVGDRIGFSTGMGKLTKAGETGDDTTTGTGDAEKPDAEKDGLSNLRLQNFRVWAYYVKADSNTGAKEGEEYDGMVDSEVTYSLVNEKDTWTPDKEYYWPGKGKDLKFFAVSGVKKGEVTMPVTDQVLTENKITISNFTVAPADANTDLMVADFVQQHQNDNKGAVALSFNHALSKVEFLFQTLTGITEKIHVQKLEIGGETPETTGLINKGTLTVTTENTTFGKDNSDIQCEAKLEWDTKTSTPVKFEDDWTTTSDDFPEKIVKVGSTQETTPDATDKQAMLLTTTAEEFTTWLMIPQNIEGKTVTVTYTIDKRQFKAIFPLSVENTLTSWAVNQYVKYTVTLAPNKITFSATVKPWDNEQIELDDATEEETTKTYTLLGTIGKDQAAVAYYYEGELKKDTQLYVKSENDYVAAGDSVEFTITLEDGATVVVNGGKVTEVTAPQTPETPETTQQNA